MPSPAGGPRGDLACTACAAALPGCHEALEAGLWNLSGASLAFGFSAGHARVSTSPGWTECNAASTVRVLALFLPPGTFDLVAFCSPDVGEHRGACTYMSLRPIPTVPSPLSHRVQSHSWEALLSRSSCGSICRKLTPALISVSHHRHQRRRKTDVSMTGIYSDNRCAFLILSRRYGAIPDHVVRLSICRYDPVCAHNRRGARMGTRKDYINNTGKRSTLIHIFAKGTRETSCPTVP
ncbi:hypothetical protein GY45DRAFT_18647 [Cubamyces sp. BRFM 1775]|nr:hypothetical protein GY45DRAFT_18647 [Cubamyces sp. BRFM 1775]